jgi:hypothetical protein
MPLLGHTQLHQHDRLPPPPQNDDSEEATTSKIKNPGRGVTHLPEHLSHTYRNRVPKLSPSNRNPGDHHEPETHRRSDQQLVNAAPFTLTSERPFPLSGKGL